MFGSTVLDVIVGVIVIFLAISLATSAVTEGIASFLGLRSATLFKEVGKVLNDPKFTGLARDLYNHALINPRSQGTAQTPSDKDLQANRPAYIDPKQFATALLDVVNLPTSGFPDIATMKAAISRAVPEGQVRDFLTKTIDRTAGDVSKMHTEIATWFDTSMDRVSGTYKRKTQLISFLIALVIAVALNIDVVQAGKTLWLQPLDEKALVSVNKSSTYEEAVKQIEQAGVPIGWSAGHYPFAWDQRGFGFNWGPWDWVAAGIGWLLAAVSTIFGAPFWFDALQTFVRLKGSGPSPQEKVDGTGAAA